MEREFGVRLQRTLKVRTRNLFCMEKETGNQNIQCAEMFSAHYTKSAISDVHAQNAQTHWRQQGPAYGDILSLLLPCRIWNGTGMGMAAGLGSLPLAVGKLMQPIEMVVYLPTIEKGPSRLLKMYPTQSGLGRRLWFLM